MITPLQSDDVLLADIERTCAEPDGFRLWWLGQSGFLVQHQGRHLLLDPYLSDSLTTKYARTDKPHVRMTRRVIAPERLDFVDAATSSHNHTDHLDAGTLGPLIAVNPGLELIIPEANRAFVAERLGMDPDWPRGLTDGASTSVAGFTFHGVPAAHNALDTDDAGRHLYMGFVVAFGGYTIYHSGDTLRYEGMVERLRRFAIDVALLPINGNRPERRVAGNLDGAEAAQLGKDFWAKVVIPCHYEMFEFNTASPALFVETCERIGQAYRVLRAGEKFAAL
jgi:L-ascorbate metabolism protein UlaG (beta-lactamase superfamily)